MKKGFMNKKCTEMTGWEVLKFTGILTVALMALVYIPMSIVMFWSNITEWFSKLWAKIQSKFCWRKENWVNDKEEDEEL